MRRGGSKSIRQRRKVKCSQCDFTSSQAGNLRTHLITHSGEKLNKCNHCDYAFSQAGNLRRHLKKYTGEKTIKCKQCDFKSSQASNLRAHLKIHSGEKSHKCNQKCIEKFKVEKRQTNANSATLYPHRQAI